VLASLGEYSLHGSGPEQRRASVVGQAAMGVVGWLWGDRIANTAITGLAELQQSY
jgi:hypothetical protein